jgi:adenylate cyclase
VGPQDAAFAQTVREARRSVLATTAGDRTTLTVYNPLLNVPRCAGCHGADHTVRGVTGIRYDITPLARERRLNLALSGAIFVGVVLLLTATLTAWMHAWVIDPVKRIGDVCTTVTRGQLDVSVHVRNRDEIGVLADTINEMILGLHERFELSKFVSSSTLRSIRNREKGARVSLTLLFSDVRGFTSFTERNPPERVVESLNRILNAQTEIIHRSGGDVDKYVGDEVFALFSGVDHAFRACHAALEIQREITRAEGTAYGGLSVGIGVDTGEVILGMIGSEKRADYTVIGDHVNFAARLCSAARPAQVIVSEATWKAADRKVPAKGPYRVQVKGKSEPQRVYILEEQGARA